LSVAKISYGDFGGITREAQIGYFVDHQTSRGRIVSGYDAIRKDLYAERDESQMKLQEFVTKKGLTDKERDKLANALRNPEELPELMKDKKLSDTASEAVNRIFGKDVPDAQVDTLFNSLIDANSTFDDSIDKTIKKRIN